MEKLWSLLRRILRLEPPGYTLIRSDGRRHNRIRGDLIAAGSMVIIEDGRVFVRQGEVDDVGFEIYREGFRTHTWVSWS
jgi:hypothetical protein